MLSKYNGLIFNLNIIIPTKDVTIIPPNEPSTVFFGLIFVNFFHLKKIVIFFLSGLPGSEVFCVVFPVSTNSE